jgi:zinc transport system substrate-binding protein
MKRRFLPPVPVALALSLAVSSGLAGCGGAVDAGAPGAAAAGRDGRLAVVASFYPLQFAAERVGADEVSVTSLTKPGAEPHDLELSPRDVASLEDADLVVYLAGFQPSVDEGVAASAADRGVDVTPSARLDLEGPEHEEHEDDAHGDPHFWLDPTRLADVADALARRFAQAAPQHAATFTANAATLRKDLTTLDGEFRAGLATCASRSLVTSHEAFGYLARRYDLQQVGISGLSPEAEPDAATIARVAEFVRSRGVRTVYVETLVSPDIARTVAAETGARTAVLDPIEGPPAADSGARDYLGVMRADLAVLRAGQGCS